MPPRHETQLSRHSQLIISQEFYTFSGCNLSPFIHGRGFYCEKNSLNFLSSLIACITGYGIGKFTELNVKNALKKQKFNTYSTAI